MRKENKRRGEGDGDGEKVDEIKCLISEFIEYGNILQRSLQRIPKN
jgi:hypothetical protein